jgi:hypothetical protein
MPRDEKTRLAGLTVSMLSAGGKTGGGMSARIVRIVIPVHPPEADSIANAFGGAQNEIRNILIRLRALSASLDREWEGAQKTRFMAESGIVINRCADDLIPNLTNWENKYRVLMMDQTIEVTEYY